MPLTPYGGDGNSDWLQSLLASYGAGQPYGPGGPPTGGVGPRGAYVPGGGVTGYQAATPGAPSMGYPAMGQPGQQPAPAPAAQNPIMRALNYFNPIGSAQAAEAEPGVWAMRHGMPQNPDLSGLLRYASGSPGGPGAGPGGPGSAGDDAGSNNPYAAAATANPAQGGPYVGSGAPPMVTQPGPAPAGVGGPYVGGQGATPIDRNNPLPWRPSGSSPATTVANAPPGNPSATPRPARPVTPTPRPKTTAASSNPRFGQVQYQVPGSGMGPLSRSPIYSTLNLFGAKG